MKEQTSNIIWISDEICILNIAWNKHPQEIIYLKFKFKWVSCMKSQKHTPHLSATHLWMLIYTLLRKASQTFQNILAMVYCVTGRVCLFVPDGVSQCSPNCPESHCITSVGFHIRALCLPQPSKYWDFRNGHPRPLKILTTRIWEIIAECN